MTMACRNSRQQQEEPAPHNDQPTRVKRAEHVRRFDREVAWRGKTENALHTHRHACIDGPLHRHCGDACALPWYDAAQDRGQRSCPESGLVENTKWPPWRVSYRPKHDRPLPDRPSAFATLARTSALFAILTPRSTRAQSQLDIARDSGGRSDVAETAVASQNHAGVTPSHLDRINSSSACTSPNPRYRSNSSWTGMLVS